MKAWDTSKMGPIGVLIYTSLTNLGKVPSDIHKAKVLSNGFLSAIMSGKASPSEEKQAKLAKFLKIPIEEIAKAVAKQAELKSSGHAPSPVVVEKKTRRPRESAQQMLPILVGDMVDERDRAIQAMMGRMPKKNSSNQILIDGEQLIKRDCPLCSGKGHLWTTVVHA